MRRTLMILAFLSVTAHAEPRRYTRKAAVPTSVAPAAPAQPRHPHPAQPGVTADDMLAIEEGNQPIRREQEKVLEGLVRDTPDDDPQKPDLLFRLAEHYAQQLRFWRLKEIEATVSRP